MSMKTLKDRLVEQVKRQGPRPGAVDLVGVLRERKARLAAYKEAKEARSMGLGLPARAGLPDDDEARYEWYIANHHALDLDPYAGSEWTGGQQ